MRQIVLDTETTGLEWKKGNRIVEIGCVELVERRPTGRHYHQYIKPDRDFEQGAAEVTGLNLEILADKPRFDEIADEFLAFVDGAELVIHNASFDMGFLEYELSRLEGYAPLKERVSVLDSLAIARERYPGQRNSLDALCRRLGVDNSHRQLHGALLDAQLLAEVYLALTSGQGEIGFGGPPAEDGGQGKGRVALSAQSFGPRPRLMVPDADMALHVARIEAIRKKAGRCVWD